MSVRRLENTFVYSRATWATADKYTDSKIVPDILPKSPAQTLVVQYENVTVSLFLLPFIVIICIIVIIIVIVCISRPKSALTSPHRKCTRRRE